MVKQSDFPEVAPQPSVPSEDVHVTMLERDLREGSVSSPQLRWIFRPCSGISFVPTLTPTTTMGAFSAGKGVV